VHNDPDWLWSFVFVSVEDLKNVMGDE